MGLDQCAYTRADDQEPSEAPAQFIWRKHAKLQEFMEQLYVERTDSPADELNCGELELLAEDIEQLKQLVENDHLPTSTGGFFYGINSKTKVPLSIATKTLSFADGPSIQSKLTTKCIFLVGGDGGNH